MKPELSALEPLLTRLHGNGRLRVWSVVVTIFGDLIQPRQQPLSVKELLALTGPIGIEENALRTALSRLAKEGWVERHKQGRLAFYALSDTGRQTFLAASERIYHHAFTSASPHWYLAKFNGDPEPAINRSRALNLSRQWQLINEEDRRSVDTNDAMIVKAEALNVPDWAIAQMVPQTLTDHYHQLLSDLVHFRDNDKVITSLSPASAMAARILLVHAWRRLVLRHPLMPQRLLPDDWPGLLCHKCICSCYPTLVAQAEPWWSEPTNEAGLALLRSRFNSR